MDKRIRYTKLIVSAMRLSEEDYRRNRKTGHWNRYKVSLHLGGKEAISLEFGDRDFMGRARSDMLGAGKTAGDDWEIITYENNRITWIEVERITPADIWGNIKRKEAQEKQRASMEGF